MLSAPIDSSAIRYSARCSFSLRWRSMISSRSSCVRASTRR